MTKSLSKIDITEHILHCLKAKEGDHKIDRGGSIVFKYISNVKEEFNLVLVINCTHTVKRNKNVERLWLTKSLNLRWLSRSM